MNVIETELPGVLIFEPKVFGDDRGFFVETYNASRYADHGLDLPFVQDNLSFSRRGTLRGLHFQNPRPQGKLVSVLQGEVYDVAVDVRADSPTFGRWVGAALSSADKRQMYVPPGFAHGFCVTSETALFAYKCTDFYDLHAEGAVAWDDPDLGIDWPARDPILSPKDRAAMRLKDVPPGRLAFGSPGRPRPIGHPAAT